MIVWSIIPVKDYIILKYYGELAMVDITKSPTVTYRYKDRIEVDDNVLRTYNWISNKLREKDPEDYGLKYPRWFWYRYNNVEGKDMINELFSEECLSRDNCMLCSFNLNDNKVLLSDHEDWHAPLNNWYCSTDDKWTEDGELKFTFTEEQKIKSWNRIFDIENKPFVQGITWKLFYKDLVDVRFYRGQKYGGR